jgi:arylsulfatase A-like enzyme
MNATKKLVGIVIALVGIVPAVSWAQTTTPATAAKPNIVLILADDMDYADVLDGRKLAPTPNINSIAKNGVNFTNAYVTCPVCGPSRVAILTGQYQDRVGFDTNHGPQIPENFGLPTTVTLVSETLKKAGYATGMIGKWHLGFEPDMVPNAQGFDYFFGHLHGAHDYNAGVEKPGPILRNTTPVKTTQYLTREFGDEAAQFIRKHKDSPYFLYVPFNAVHGPWQAPEETLEKFSSIKNHDDRLMAAMMSELDQAVGKILQAVKESGDEQNTIVIFTNDNGGVGGHKPEANGEFRGGKAMVYEGGIRVPFMMQWKGTLPAGKTYDKTISTLDLTPTFVAAGNAQSSVKYDGVDLMPFLLGKNDGTPNPELFWNFVDAPNQKAVRKGDWKAVQMAPRSSWELYNLATDVGETNNLAEENRDKLNELRRDWQEWNKTNPPPAWLDIRIVNKRNEEAKKTGDQQTSGTKPAQKPGKKKRRKVNR